MAEIQSSESIKITGEELLYFWALGDLHYCSIDQWQAFHTQRLTPMFQDLRMLWAEAGAPAFCVSPGDIVEMSTPENYQLAKKQLTAQLGKLPFYPGIGNHELYGEDEENPDHLIQDYTAFWGKPTRYYWVEGEVLCIMLDPVGYPEPYMTQESLTFLQTALAKHPQHISIIFCHCPLYNTILARDPERILDYHSLDPFFSLQNSAKVRAIFAKHKNVVLYVSGHTHSGWGAPNLVYTEELGGHPVTHVNLMSPWYTGYHKGVSLGEARKGFTFSPDDPDLVVSFAIHIYRDQAIIRLREHRQRRWLAEWIVSLN